MSKFEIEVSVIIEVEADSEEEACEIATDAALTIQHEEIAAASVNDTSVYSAQQGEHLAKCPTCGGMGIVVNCDSLGPLPCGYCDGKGVVL